ncbi:hypothetical protein HID58_014951 [Brassica napus]|uniref:Uncharacterized protein n=1 Tax=Brassica napus TaxID=3708 RepID=A0ABQ8DIP8_BRANA|nr:hypothetical protein HID58_014951 [Brassica napus]
MDFRGKQKKRLPSGIYGKFLMDSNGNQKGLTSRTGKTGEELGVASRLLTPSLVLLIAELPVPHRLLTPLSSYIPIAHIFPSSRKVIAHFPNIEDSSSTSSRDESYPTLSLPPFVIAHFSGRAFLPTSLPRSHRSSIH